MWAVTQRLLLGGERAATQLDGLGVRGGGVLLVHGSMRSAGGDAEAMAGALRRALGPEGTLVVPAFTPENSDTSRSYLDRVHGLSEQARAAVRATMPPFDPAVSPARAMGALAETVRLTPGALRSGHPQTSFAAIGPAADKLLAGHRQDCHLGEDSPLARLYEADAQVLLLGTGFESCTAFHLAEYRLPAPARRLYRCVVAPEGRRRWWQYEDIELDDSDFPALGHDFVRRAAEGSVRTGTVGSARSRLFRFRAAVDFATEWLKEHRPGTG
ncbi:aminoglycoside N(3)-acetyltransferase [Streptomyces sp. NBC_00059]|uniref:aminoglycoside N(3)-acetyltransferase n=1 Tax=Streptomyces sp. NBC_00059 TaxID=2975635 RepID=UPI00225A8AC9|nr:AAC(3) family N-acetyltransferase [Streptomyces sp. NBC_00059]MCX5414144.1 AAC(3) family N-acetyltransferase [Streptomyces sp. NBC_00059]